LLVFSFYNAVEVFPVLPFCLTSASSTVQLKPSPGFIMEKPKHSC